MKKMMKIRTVTTSPDMCDPAQKRESDKRGATWCVLHFYRRLASAIGILFLGMLVIQNSLTAQSKTVVHTLPYVSLANYNGAFFKENAFVGGVYNYFGFGIKHSLEADASYTRIRFGSRLLLIDGFEFRTQDFRINQFDLTLAYTNYQLTNLLWRIGTHLIFTDDQLTDRSYVFFAGLKRYRSNEYNAGLDIFGSFYNNYEPNLRVLQVTGTFGFYFGNFFTYGGFYAETRGHYIRLSDDVGFCETQYPSVRQALSYYYKKITVEGFWWAGFQAFAVQNDGFVVYNLAERHLGAVGGAVKFILGKKASLKLKFAQGRFKELGADAVVKSNTVTVVGGISW